MNVRVLELVQQLKHLSGKHPQKNHTPSKYGGSSGSGGSEASGGSISATTKTKTVNDLHKKFGGSTRKDKIRSDNANQAKPKYFYSSQSKGGKGGSKLASELKKSGFEETKSGLRVEGSGIRDFSNGKIRVAVRPNFNNHNITRVEVWESSGPELVPID